VLKPLPPLAITPEIRGGTFFSTPTTFFLLRTPEICGIKSLHAMRHFDHFLLRQNA